jgi:hypothetical protein
VPSKLTSARGNARTNASAVDQFHSRLEHPHKDAIEALRRIVRNADVTIAEGIKWNVPSFRTTEYFATTHLRAKSGVGLAFHLGAKARAVVGVPIDDPHGHLQWLAKDRATAAFADVADVVAKGPALKSIVRQWIKHV